MIPHGAASASWCKQTGGKVGKKQKESPPPSRVGALVLRDSPEYRDWLASLSAATMIPVTQIARDAIARWAADRGLPPPPSGPGSEPAEEPAPSPPPAPKRRGRPRKGAGE